MYRGVHKYQSYAIVQYSLVLKPKTYNSKTGTR